MMEEEGKKIRFCRAGVGHGRATIGTGRANLLDFGFGLGMLWHGRATAGTGRATAGTGRAKLLASQAQNFVFSVFSNRSRTITYKIT